MNLSGPDLDACASEPIRIPGAIQPHGALMVLNISDFRLVHASDNLQLFSGLCVSVGQPLDHSDFPCLNDVRAWLDTDEALFKTTIPDRNIGVTVHRLDTTIMIELEQSNREDMEGLLSKLTRFAQQLVMRTEDVDDTDVLTTTARFIMTLTGFDRAMIYRFDNNWNGQVVAEAGNGTLPSYLDLRFPSSDIPAQARDLYARNRVRIIPDVDYQPVKISPDRCPRTGQAVDLGPSQLRSVSPVHLEYMRNMGTSSSMSVSIMVNGMLWGLVSCHGRQPHYVSGVVRDACDFAVQSLAMRISARANAQDAARRVTLGRVHGRLLAAMTASPVWFQGLERNPRDLLDQVDACGAVVVVEGQIFTLGETPDTDAVAIIVDWLNSKPETEYLSSDALSADMGGGEGSEGFADLASGIIAISLSELHGSWLIWFRPEVIRSVTWGGNPHKTASEDGRIHPRKSFEAWKEQVRFTARPWQEAEIAAARDLRNAIIGIVLRKAEELAQLSEELLRSNKELEAFSYSVSHDLRAPFRHIVGFAQLLRERSTDLDAKSLHYIKTISDSALAAGRLVDDLLNFSQLGRMSISHKRVDMDKLVAEVRKTIAVDLSGRNIDWDVSKLPEVLGDATLLRQVWFNLIENAVKYSRPRNPAVIIISASQTGKHVSFTVRDNGVGFDMAYYDKLFGVFQRLQRAEDFEGTGIGLALVRRIIERHDGRIAAEGEVDRGAAFTFTLPATTERETSLA